MAEFIPPAIGIGAIILGAIYMIVTRPKPPSGTNDKKGGYE